MTDASDPRGPSEIDPGRSLYGHELDGWLLDGLGVGPGDTVLELAGGRGGLAVKIAERVRPGGTVICSDRRPERVADAASAARQTGATEVDARVIDMLDIDLPDAAVDAVLCRWGLMFPVPTATALSEAFRVLRPGRWLTMAVHGDPARNPWATLGAIAIREAGLEPPDESSPGEMLSLSDSRRLEDLLRRVGFDAIELAEIPLDWAYPDADAYWAVDVRWAGSPVDDFLKTLPADVVADIRARVDRLLGAFRSPAGGYRMPGLSLAAKARRSR
jgi:SAM-dependent methyltransferase